MTVRVCVAIRESTTQNAVEAMQRAARWADIVEVRADFIRDLDLRRLFERKPCPVLFTLRSSREGGEYHGAEASRLETVVAAANFGADLVDVEFSAYWKAVLNCVAGPRVVLSHHDFECTSEGLETVADRMAEAGAGTLKIATRARCLADNTRILQLLRHGRQRRLNLCAMAMGRAGIPSRVLGPLWGSCLTFASLPGSPPTADGQLPADHLVDLYRVRRISELTRLYGVLGRPIGHSLSPLLHNVAFAARPVDAVYLPLEAEGIDDFSAFVDSVPFDGVSVTIPYKEELKERVCSLSVEADRVGCVNTLVRSDRGWHGENTDVEGFLRPLLRRTNPGRLRSVVLGAGGAARAVVYAMRSQGAPVFVVARDREKARRLAGTFGAESAAWPELERLRWDLLVNTTPIGMSPAQEESPVGADFLKGTWVYDLVYNPAQTRLLREAGERGCKTISGAEMFLWQAAKQQQVWLGTPVPIPEMTQALQSEQAGGNSMPRTAKDGSVE